LMEGFAAELENMAEPSFPLSDRDKLLDTIAKDTERTQPRIPFFRHSAHTSTSIGNHSGRNSPSYTNKHSIFSARLDAARRAASRGSNSQQHSTLIPSDITPLSNFSGNVPTHTSPQNSDSHESFHITPSPVIRETHAIALLRILYIFSLLHPHQPYTQGLNELVAPLYFVLCSDTDGADATHAEADTFWIFNELMGEIGEVVGQTGDWSREGAEDGMKGAMRALSERLRWADEELWTDMKKKIT